MSNLLIKWNTARLLHQHIDKLEFMNNFSAIDSGIADRYKALYKYYDDHYRDVSPMKSSSTYGGTNEIFDELITHLDKVTELQLYAAQNPTDAAGISDLAKGLFPDDPNAGEIKGAVGYDLNIYQELHALLDYAAPMQTMLNMNYKLTAGGQTLTLEEEQVIRAYVDERTQ